MADCLTQSATSGSASSSAPNAVSISSPNITQVRSPRRDDGRWMAMGAMMGTILGKYANQDIIDKAIEAEDTWRELTDKMKEVGVEEFTVHAQAIRQCNDDIWQKFCDYVLCGYKPDYTGILSRVRADAALVTASKKSEALRISKRYNVGINANVASDLLRTEVLATVGAASAARESERQMMWKINTDLIGNAAIRFETAYQGRIDLGAKLMASAGENYAFLAESLRRTAEKNMSDAAAIGAIIGVLLPLLFGKGITIGGIVIPGFGCPHDTDCGCAPTTPPLPVDGLDGEPMDPEPLLGIEHDHEHADGTTDVTHLVQYLEDQRSAPDA